jgi:hypothetical protein
MPEQRPASDEYAPHHQRYIDALSGSVLTALRDQRADVVRLVSIPESSGGHRYAEGKWTVREVIGHLSDAERIYQFRALAFARGDTGQLPKYDPDGYVEWAEFDRRTISSLVAEFLTVREATIAFYENLDAEAWSRKGSVGGAFAVSVRALAYISVGHVRQHLDVLRDRYGVAP